MQTNQVSCLSPECFSQEDQRGSEGVSSPRPGPAESKTSHTWVRDAKLVLSGRPSRRREQPQTDVNEFKRNVVANKPRFNCYLIASDRTYLNTKVPDFVASRYL